MVYKSEKFFLIMEELWLPITGYEQFYLISNLGRIQTLGRFDYGGNQNSLRRKKSKFLKTSDKRDRYKHVNLYDADGNIKSCSVHLLVLETFKGPRPDGQVGRHLNGDKHDNVLSNLDYGTQQDNLDDARIHGTLLFGEKNPQAKLTQTDVISILHSLENGEKGVHLAKKYNVTQSAISIIKHGKRWSHVKDTT